MTWLYSLLSPVRATECSEPKATILMWIPTTQSTLVGEQTILFAPTVSTNSNYLLSNNTIWKKKVIINRIQKKKRVEYTVQ